jgi:acetyl esterase/lipase/lysophospholipase L1-like esterase
MYKMMDKTAGQEPGLVDKLLTGSLRGISFPLRRNPIQQLFYVVVVFWQARHGPCVPKGAVMPLRQGFLTVVIACTLMAAGPRGDLRAATSIVCVGNSITAGSKLPDTTRRFPSVLKKKLGIAYLSQSITNLSSPVNISNNGVSGRTLLKKGTQPYWIEPAFSQVFTAKPDIITLMLGTNDTKPINWAYSSEFEADYIAMVDTFASISSHPKIILCLPTPIFSNCTTSHSDSAMLYGVIPAILKIAKTKGLPVIDARTPFLDKQNLFAGDGLHPDTTGHKILSDLFYEGIVNFSSGQIYKIRFLWYGNAPGIIGAEGDTTAKPFLHVYPAPANINTRAAIVICPGGTYDHLAIQKEGDTVAQWFAKKGVSAFVVRYRYKPYQYPIPMNDAKRAVRIVRCYAESFGIDTTKIGLMGFSAGGHVASTIGTHYDNGNGSGLDPIEMKKCRPDFMALMYSVITLTGTYAHIASRDNLMGTSPAPSAALLDSLSNQKWVTAQTPPTFLAHGDADKSVPIQNSILFDSACAAHNVAHKFMADPGRAHGYGMAGLWPDTLLAWMHAIGIISSSLGLKGADRDHSHRGASFPARRVSGKGLIISFPDESPHRIIMYSISGKRVAEFWCPARGEWVWRPPSKGVFVAAVTGNGVTREKIIEGVGCYGK